MSFSVRTEVKSALPGFMRLPREARIDGQATFASKATARPCASRPPRSFTMLAGRYMPCCMSSSRDHITFTGLPGIAIATFTPRRT